MEPYTPIVPFEVLSARLGRPPEAIVKLDANENPYGPSPRAREALARLAYAHIYPDPESTALRHGLAAFTGLPADNLLAGAGADELIDLVMRLFLEPGDTVVDCPPTFGMYAFDTALNAGQVVRVPRRDDFSVDVDAVAQAVAEHRPKLLFLTSPNNPDGSVLSDEALRRLLALPVVVVLDEAYIEFHGLERSRGAWVLERDNLITLRTFSKLAGLAGLRVGYGVFPGVLMPHLWKIKQPYNVSVAASAAALAALEDTAGLRENVARLVAERERLAMLLAGIPYLRPFPSRANFILCRVLGRDARALKLALEARGILIRYFNKPGLTDCIRVSVGRPEQTTALVEALEGL
jgi:histidinol-phosphate aminotransferase